MPKVSRYNTVYFLRYIHPRYDEMFVYKHTETIAYFLRKIQTSRLNNSRILRFKNAKLSRNYLYMMCISVPLTVETLASS